MPDESQVPAWHGASHAERQQWPPRHIRLPWHMTSPPHDWPGPAPGALAHIASVQAEPAGHVTTEVTHIPVLLHFFEESEALPEQELPQSKPSWRGWQPEPLLRQLPVRQGPWHDEAMQQVLPMHVRPLSQSEV
jgi:hypothetical protein